MKMCVFPDARSEDQICHCVCQGERPDEALIPPDTPQDLIELMKTCWKEDPRHRPTFKGRSLEGSSGTQNQCFSTPTENASSLQTCLAGNIRLV